MHLSNFVKVFTTADFFLITLILIATLLSAFFFYGNSNDKMVEILYQNKLYGIFPLKTDRIINISEGIVVEIKNGKVRLKEDTSPLQIGVKQGWSNIVPIISVPSKLVIRFRTSENRKMIVTY